MEKRQVPKHEKGKKLDLSDEKIFNSEQDATRAFDHARKKLLDIDHWHEIAGSTSALFKLCNGFGHPIHRQPKMGDFVRIDIPGPGSFIGGGYDWVIITDLQMKAHEQRIQLTLQPVHSPETSDANAPAAHFFKPEASSTFLIYAKEEILSVHYYGRNEQTNLDSDFLVENMRNALIGLAAKLGLSYPQWKKLVSGFLT